MKQNNLPEKLICESCHEEFFCGANTGKCWCFNLDISPANLAQLKKDFQRCLCSQCLEKIESAKIPK